MTNSLCLPFAFLLAIDGNGGTIAVSACILANETVESFDWVMARFREICQGPICQGKKNPKVFYTDRCAAIHRSLLENFGASHHLLCRWHLAKNILKNLSSVLKSSVSTFVSEFYHLAEGSKDPDTFLEQWRCMLTRYELHGFVMDLFDCRDRWAKCFHNDALDFGLTTTSRSESMNAWVKRLVNTQTRLSTLFKVSTVDLAEAQMTETILAEIKSIRNIKKVTLSQSMSPLLKGAVRVLLEYPLSIFLNQLHLSNDYRGAIVDPLTMSGTIVHRTTQSGHVVIFDPPSCACGFFGSMGLPCRHYLCLAAGLFQDSLPLTAFHRRWT